MARKTRWEEMTSRDFDAPDRERWVAVLPIAAVEQHGPHLPVGTDALIAEGMVGAVLERLPDDLPAIFLPVERIGKSNEHILSPGTLTLDWETLGRVLVETGEGVARAGLRRLVIINAHGGNVAHMDIVARELRVMHNMFCVATNWFRFGTPDGLFSDRERAFGIHGGDIETSILLALRPDLVDMARAQDFPSAQEAYAESYVHLRAHGPAQFGWLAQDLNPEGVVGNASSATAEKGRAVIAHQADGFITLLREVSGFPLEGLASA